MRGSTDGTPATSMARANLPGRAAPPARTPALFGRTSWSPRHELELSEWALQGRRLGALGRACNWWLGDWVRYGNARYGERYELASKITGYSTQSLMNMAYVASRFGISRRRESLSWSHHAELAALDPADQEHWLDRAERERLSVLLLRVERRQPEKRPRVPPGTRQRALPAPAARHERDAPEPDGASAEAAHVVCPNCGHGFHAEG